jgi:ankyrin repeat protein
MSVETAHVARTKLDSLARPWLPAVMPTRVASHVARRMATGILALAVIALGGTAAEAADTRLADAAMKRDAAAVRALLAQKVDVNAPDAQGTPALHAAVRVDDLEMARVLLAAGATATLANRYGVTPLTLATTNGNPEMMRTLLAAGADPNAVDPAGDSMLVIAARVGVLEAVQLLIDRGAVVDAKDAVYQQTALMVAVREGHPAIVKALLDQGAAVNAKTRTGQTPGWVLPNSVPGFGHGVGIVRGGLPPRGSRQPIPASIRPTPTRSRR